MKKKLLAITLTLLSWSVYSAQSVAIVWPFAVGSNQANFVRAIIDEANRSQSKYVFYLENKPGAGGSIAANYVLNSSTPAILSMSSSFFMRPFFYPNESYNISDFQPLLIECTGSPLAVISSRYKSLSELKKAQRITIGMQNGGITEAVSRELKTKLPNTELEFIPYPNSVVSTQDAVAGHIDASVDFLGDIISWADAEKINIIGISGRVTNKSFYKQGVTGFEDIVGNYQMVVSNKMPGTMVNELHTILTDASKRSLKLPELYAKDYCTPASLDMNQTKDLFASWSKYWPEKLNSLKQQ